MQLQDVVLNDPDVFAKATPHDMFTVLREQAPVFWHEEEHGSGFFAITRHADVKWVSKQPALFSSERMATLMMDPDPGQLAFMQQIMINMDPPRHRQYRQLINKAFTPRMVGALHGRIRGMVDQIMDGVAPRGECDFVEDVAAQLPMWVICEMMGVPEEDRRRVYELGNKMVGFDDPELQEDGKPLVVAGVGGDEGMAASAEMFAYAGKLLQKAREHPTDDLATALVNAELDGQKLSDDEFHFFFMLLLIAGNETTRTVTTNGMIELLNHPDQLRDLREDPSLVDSAVEEILRFAPAVHTFRRQSLQEVELRGTTIPAGSKVMLYYGAANRDEEVFPNAQQFDIRRTPNDHLAFGIGEHYCLGANLARLELREIFRGITARLHDIETTAEPRRLRSAFINGVKEMQIRFRPAPPTH